MNVYMVLDQEWVKISSTLAANTRLTAWASTEPALSGSASPAELVAGIVARRQWGRGDPQLTALVRVAGDPFAARSALQAILPALRREPLFVARHGLAPAARGQDHADVAVELLAAAWEAIRTRAGQTLGHPENDLVRVAVETLRTRRRAEVRHVARTVVTATPADRRSCDLHDAITSAERVLAGLIDAVRAGTVSAREAEILYAVRVAGTPGHSVGRAHDMTTGQVFYTIRTAEKALRCATA